MKKILILFFLSTVGFASCGKTKFVDIDPQLEITVVNDKGDLISGVDVRLYESLSDMDSNANEVRREMTDSKGIVHFTKLEPKVYYFSAKKGELTNNDATVQLSKALQYNKNAKIQIIIK